MDLPIHLTEAHEQVISKILALATKLYNERKQKRLAVRQVGKFSR